MLVVYNKEKAIQGGDHNTYASWAKNCGYDLSVPLSTDKRAQDFITGNSFLGYWPGTRRVQLHCAYFDIVVEDVDLSTFL